MRPATYAGQVIARFLLAVSLVLLVAAPAEALAGSVQIEILVEEPAPPADEDAAAPQASVHAASRDGAARPAPSEVVVPTGLALARIFRPPRPSFD